MPLSADIAAVRSAAAIIHRDRDWWRKVLVGGALWVTLAGYALVEGYQIESIENTRNGFPAPLPLWGAWGNKALNGLFAAVIDFFFFGLPVLLAFLALLCVAASLAIAGAAANTLQRASAVPIVGGAAWLLVAWLSSASPVAKQLFVADGQPTRALSTKPIRDAWRRPARAVYLRARVRSAPLYLPAIALLAAAWYGAGWSAWLALGLAWLALSALLYARLVVIQLYAAASREVEQLRYAEFQARLTR